MRGATNETPRAAFPDGYKGWRHVKEGVLFFNKLGLVFAPLPAVPPIAYQELETKCVDLHAGLEADAEVSKVHLVLDRMRK